MKSKQKVAVLGGGGRTGQFLVRELLQQRYPMKLLLRTPNNFDIQDELIEIVKGDACDLAAIEQLLKDCHAVISTIGQRKDEPLVAVRSTQNLLNSMARNKFKRCILLAGLNIDMPGDKKSQKTIAATEWMKNNFPHIQEDRQKAYGILLESDLDWTIARTPFIIFEPKSGNIRIDLEDCIGELIKAGDIADFLVKQLSETRFIRHAPFIANA